MESARIFYIRAMLYIGGEKDTERIIRVSPVPCPKAGRRLFWQMRGIKMYRMVEIVVIVLALLCGVQFMRMRKTSENDTAGREAIIDYFKEQQAFSVETGIKIKDLPREIAESQNLLMMAADRTLKFKKGKYYLNVN